MRVRDGFHARVICGCEFGDVADSVWGAERLAGVAVHARHRDVWPQEATRDAMDLTCETADVLTGIARAAAGLVVTPLAAPLLAAPLPRVTLPFVMPPPVRPPVMPIWLPVMLSVGLFVTLLLSSLASLVTPMPASPPVACRPRRWFRR
jgi:hypothetical protein